MGHCGIALSASLASTLNLILLVAALVRRIGFPQWKSVMLSACKTMTGSAIMGGCVWLMARWIIPAPDKPSAPLFWGFSGCVVFGVAVYAASCYVLKSPELESLSREENDKRE